MPVVLDDLTYHGRVRVDARILPIHKVAAMLRKGMAHVSVDPRDHNALRCDVCVGECRYRFIVAVTKTIGGVRHGVLVTGYAL